MPKAREPHSALLALPSYPLLFLPPFYPLNIFSHIIRKDFYSEILPMRCLREMEKMQNSLKPQTSNMPHLRLLLLHRLCNGTPRHLRLLLWADCDQHDVLASNAPANCLIWMKLPDLDATCLIWKPEQNPPFMVQHPFLPMHLPWKHCDS